ncbi:MAG: ankyrin repeat domain-containing protein [Vicinamibacterales bacterium]
MKSIRLRLASWCTVLVLVFAANATAQAPRTRGNAAPDLRLVEAVRSQDRQRIAAAFKLGADVKSASPDGSTALHWAVYWEDVETAERLIRAGANVKVANDLGMTPLVLACSNTTGVLVEKLLAAGADANTALASGETALMLAARAGNVAAVRALLAGGANVNAREQTHSQTALMWAVANVRPEVTRLLLDRGAEVSARAATSQLVFNMGGNRSAGSASAETPLEEVPLGGTTPLLFAARSGDLESAKLLLAKGANANDTLADGNTALIVAVHSGHGSVAQVLLEHGADVKAAPLGYTALHAAVLRGTLRDRGVQNTDPLSGLPLVKLLLDKGADVNARLTKGTPVRRWSHDFAFLERWSGATPFWLASKFLEVEMMRALAAAGADVTIGSRDGAPPLLVAAGYGYSRASGTEAFTKDRRDFSYYNTEPFAVATSIPAEEERLAVEAVKLLLSLGAKVNVTALNGDTAVHSAAALGMDSVIRVLAEAGADLQVKNRAGRLPADVARRDNGIGSSSIREKTVELLKTLAAK